MHFLGGLVKTILCITHIFTDQRLLRPIRWGGNWPSGDRAIVKDRTYRQLLVKHQHYFLIKDKPVEAWLTADLWSWQGGWQNGPKQDVSIHILLASSPHNRKWRCLVHLYFISVGFYLKENRSIVQFPAGPVYDIISPVRSGDCRDLICRWLNWVNV